MEDLKRLLASLLGEGGFFKKLAYGVDPKSFAIRLDEVQTLPAVGCLAMRAAETDITGQACIAFQLYGIIARDEEATEEEADAALAQLAREFHCYCSRLRPYVWRSPTSFHLFTDHALVGYWADFTASASQLAECSDCGPRPLGRFLDFLAVVNGTSSYSWWVLAARNWEGVTVEAVTMYTSSLTSAPSPSLTRIFAGATQVTYRGIAALQSVKARHAYTFGDGKCHEVVTYAEGGEVAYEGDQAINFGDAMNGALQLVAARPQNNRARGRIYSVTMSEGGRMVHDWRPWETAGGEVGLLDMVTGAVSLPSVNGGITAGG